MLNFEERTYTLNRFAEDEDIAEKDFESLKNRLNSKKSEINKVFRENEEKWRAHTKRMHPFRKIARMFNNSNFQSSQAFSKFFEILCKFQEVLPTSSKTLRSFHLCEGPGHFIAALDLYLKSFIPNLTNHWEWKANTLCPYFENTPSSSKLLDDTFIFNHNSQWIRGPKNDGDIFQLSPEFLKQSNLLAKFDLVTADGSFYVQNNPGEQENLVFELIEQEINVGLDLLKLGGTFVLKVFTIFEAKTRELIKRTSTLFEEVICYKPLCSKPGNSEKYLIFLKFLGSDRFSEVSESEFMKAETIFTNLQITAINRNLETFGKAQPQEEFEKNEELVNDFLDEIDFYSLKISKISKSLKPMISTPWKTMFGNNLVDRISKIRDFDEEIQENLGNFEEISAIPEQMVFELGEFETSNYEIKNMHSLFLDPIILYCLNNSETLNFVDIFQNCSKPSENNLQIQNCCEISVEKLNSLETFINVLDQIKENFENKIIFTWKNDSKNIHLIVSRLSASIFGLFLKLYKHFEFSEDQILFSDLVSFSMFKVLVLIGVLVCLADGCRTRPPTTVTTTQPTTTPPTITECPAGWANRTRTTGKWCVKVFLKTVNYQEAVALCAENGAVITGLQTTADRNAIARSLQALTYFPVSTIFIGAIRTSACANSNLTSTCTELNSFEWTDGVTTGTTGFVWNPLQPDNNDGNEKYVIMLRESASLSDVSAKTVVDGVACGAKPADIVTPPSDATTQAPVGCRSTKCPTGWKTYSRSVGDWCVKVFVESVNQAKADAKCQWRGGKLSGFQNAQERIDAANALWEATNNIYSYAIVGAVRTPACISSNLTETCTETNSFAWSDGVTTGTDAFAGGWEDNQPDNDNNNQIYVAVGSSSQKMMDLRYSVMMGYVCGAQPSSIKRP
ncbi:unnamed protein product [Caenorhabditis angaria]|uniref:Cap-specific mRNA (nucleoside-2'-O-)-methyltransferase 2 n=1 Tax=Caenorhabditis angaria TaxID=860376 RepID=A0A9P1IKN5_9PELO|nr:unnamed protein product [Caenorhabditis angaria]